MEDSLIYKIVDWENFYWIFVEENGKIIFSLIINDKMSCSSSTMLRNIGYK